MTSFTLHYLFTAILLLFLFYHYSLEIIAFRKLSFLPISKSGFQVLNFKVNIKSLKERCLVNHNPVKNKKESFSDLEISLKIKKYNQLLNRQLKNLIYLNVMEGKYIDNQNIKQIKRLLELKENLQQEIIKITQKISYYKSIKYSTTDLYD